jgi:isopentenyl-diphosphate Delta-isomerase
MTHADLKRMEGELLDVIDENDNILRTADKREVREKNLRHRGANVFVFNSKGEILITKRSMKRFLFPGLLELGQGGSVSHGESYEECAVREVWEEVGVKDAKIEYMFTIKYSNSHTNYIGKIFRCLYDGKIIVDGIETDSFFFISIPKLAKMIKENPELFTPDCPIFLEKYLEWKN